jgi:hypothetical protein
VFRNVASSVEPPLVLGTLCIVHDVNYDGASSYWIAYHLVRWLPWFTSRSCWLGWRLHQMMSVGANN